MNRIQMLIVLVHKDSLEKGRMIADVHTIRHNHVRIPAVLNRHWDKNWHCRLDLKIPIDRHMCELLQRMMRPCPPNDHLHFHI